MQLRQRPREVTSHPLRCVRVRAQRDRHASLVQHRQQLRSRVQLVKRLVVPRRRHLGTDPSSLECVGYLAVQRLRPPRPLPEHLGQVGVGHRVVDAARRGQAEVLAVEAPDLVGRISIPDRRQLPVHRQPSHPVHRAQQVVPVIPPDHLADLLLATAQVVDLERDLHRQAGVSRCRDGGVVAAQVAHRIGLPERVVEPVARLGEAVDVVGEADLVDPCHGRRGHVAADVLEREAVVVVGHVVVDQVHVVVGQHRRRASARSSGVVTLRLAVSPSTTATLPPAASTSDAQSVAAASTSAGCAWARRSTSARNPWGVCTATSWERSGVSTTSPALTRLTVSVTGTPGTAPSAWPSASSTRDTSSGVANGRAASCTRIRSASSGTAASPAATDAARVLPPVTAAATLPATRSSASSVAGSSQPSGTTSTIPSSAGWSSSILTEWASITSSPTPTNALGRSSPNRRPSPAPTTIAQLVSRSAKVSRFRRRSL